MKIYSKQGDAGETSLMGGERCSKTSIRFSVLGDIDELSSMIGVALSAAPTELEILLKIQKELFYLGAHLACNKADWSKYSLDNNFEKATLKLEEHIDVYQQQCGELRKFILPGGSAAGAQLHLARSICRRAERSLHAFYLSEPVETDEACQMYLNRLSDCLFALARFENKQASIAETLL